jgi:TolB-like protein
MMRKPYGARDWMRYSKNLMLDYIIKANVRRYSENLIIMVQFDLNNIYDSKLD